MTFYMLPYRFHQPPGSHPVYDLQPVNRMEHGLVNSFINRRQRFINAHADNIDLVYCLARRLLNERGLSLLRAVFALLLFADLLKVAE